MTITMVLVRLVVSTRRKSLQQCSRRSSPWAHPDRQQQQKACQVYMLHSMLNKQKSEEIKAHLYLLGHLPVNSGELQKTLIYVAGAQQELERWRTVVRGRLFTAYCLRKKSNVREQHGVLFILGRKPPHGTWEDIFPWICNMTLNWINFFINLDVFSFGFWSNIKLTAVLQKRCLCCSIEEDLVRQLEKSGRVRMAHVLTWLLCFPNSKNKWVAWDKLDEPSSQDKFIHQSIIHPIILRKWGFISTELKCWMVIFI